MKLADLSETTRQKVAKVRWDSIVEKHEGPFDWHCILDDDSEPDFFVVGTDLSQFARQIEDIPEFLIVDDRGECSDDSY